ncbi:MAG: hypothetical protein WCZ86_04180 [Desulfurivibrionaceae bacterium]|jgi:hypothetical protein
MTKQLFTPGANQELVDSLVNLGARFIIVGGLAVHYHAPKRKVGDLDILIERSPDTAEKVIAVLSSCPLIQHSITTDQLLRPKRAQIPAKIYFNADILTPGEDIDFDQHWSRAHDARIGNTPVKVAAIETLLLLLSLSKEPKHVEDIALLNQIAG